MSDVLEAAGRGAVPPYPDGVAELGDHILRINGILRNAVERFRRSHSIEQRGGLNAVAIFDDEVDRFLKALPEDTAKDDGEVLQERLRCELRAHASASHEIELPIELIKRRFGLGVLELDAFLLCIAAELHPGYGRVFAYLNNDLTRQRPTVALIVEVLSTSWRERLAARRTLSQNSLLFRCALLIPTQASPDHLNTEITVDPSMLEFVLGSLLGQNESATDDAREIDELLISPHERESVERMIRHLQRTTGGEFGTTIVVLSGSPGAGRRNSARTICRSLGYWLRTMPKATLTTLVSTDLSRWLRDVLLAGEVPGIYVQPAAAADFPPLQSFVDALVAARFELGFLFVDSDHPPRIGKHDSAQLLSIHLGAPNGSVRFTAWRRALREQDLDCSEETLSAISAVYPFNVGRIYATVRDAALRTWVADPDSRRLETKTLAQACRQQTNHQLDRLAQLLPIRHEWSDLILPSDELCRLKEIANAVRNRDLVMSQWGFEERVSAGSGVNAIFFGPSGTGKTMAASILAGDLGMAIYRVDLSRVMSKYIGETERNLDALFHEARNSFALLFFDEAEAIFGKRSEVKDAHDRYANIEVAYLLQRMEAFEGVAILATNLRRNMDNAFLRRLQFAVEFPLPKAADRLRIWQQVWPPVADLDDDVDLEFMAKHVELSGGHIRNIALMAAYLASQDQAAISMAHLVAATRREFQKLGWRGAPEPFSAYAANA